MISNPVPLRRVPTPCRKLVPDAQDSLHIHSLAVAPLAAAAANLRGYSAGLLSAARAGMCRLAPDGRRFRPLGGLVGRRRRWQQVLGHASCAARLRARRHRHSRRGGSPTHFFVGAAFFLVAFCFFAAAFFSVWQRHPHPEPGSGGQLYRDFRFPDDIWTPNQVSGPKRLEEGRSPSASSVAFSRPRAPPAERSPRTIASSPLPAARSLAA